MAANPLIQCLRRESDHLGVDLFGVANPGVARRFVADQGEPN